MAISAGTAVGYLELDASKFSKGLTGALQDLRSFTSNTTSAMEKMANLGSAITKIGTTLTKTVTLPLAAVGVAAAKASIDFEQAMSNVHAISNVSANQMEALRQKAIQMGADTKFSATESADAFYYMAQAGWDATQMMDGIEGVMSLAAAGGIELAEASDVVTTSLIAFGETADQSGRFADVLAVAAAESATGVHEMGETFKYAAPIAGALNYTLEDTALAMGLLANGGIDASMAGTSLRRIMTEMNGVVTLTGKAFSASGKEIGKLEVNTVNADGSMKPFRTTIKNLRDAFAQMTESEKAQNAEAIAGKTGMAGLLAIVEASDESYESLAESIDNSAGASKNMADTMMDNTAGAIEILSGAVESLLIVLGDKLTPAIRTVAEGLAEFVDKLASMSEEQINSVIQFAAMAASIGPVLIVIGKLIGLASSLGSVLIGLKEVIALVAGGAGNIISALGAVFPMLGPIGVGLVAIVAALTALYFVFKSNDKVIDEETQKIKDYTKESNEFIESMKQEKEAREATLKASEDNISLVDKQVERLTELNKKEHLSNGEKLEMASLVASLNETMPGLNAELDAETGHLTSSVTALQQYNAAWAEKQRLQALESIYAEQLEAQLKLELELEAAKDAQSTAQQNYNEKQREYLKVVDEEGNIFSKRSRDATKDMNEAQVALDESKTLVKELGEQYATAGNNVDTTAAKIADTSAATKAKQSILDVKEAYATASAGVKESGGKISKATRESFVEAVKSASEAGIQIPQKLIDGLASGEISVKTATKKINKKVTKTLEDAEKESEEKGAEVTQSFADGMGSNTGEVTAKAEEAAKAAKKPLDEVAGSAETSGVNAVQGFINGLASLIYKVGDTGNDIANAYLNSLNGTLIVRSPSRATFQTGIYAALGFINGVLSKKENVKKTAKELAELTLSSAKTWLDNYKVYHNVSLAEEVAYWDKIRKEVKKGTQARIDADKTYFDAKAKLDETLLKAQEDYNTSAKELNKKLVEDSKAVTDKLKADIESLTKAYEDAVTSRTNSIVSSMNLFDAYAASTDKTSASLIANLKTQVGGLEAWMKDLQTLRGKGIDEDFIAMLQDMGVSAAGEVAVIANMTDAELAEYVALWKEKNALARSEAIKELEPMAEETRIEIENLKIVAENELDALNAVFISEMKALAKTLKTEAKSAGVNIVTNIIAGINSKKSALASTLASISSMISSTMSALGGALSVTSSGLSTLAINGSHANGLDYVPFDGYIAELHEGEGILTKEENAERSKGDTFQFFGTPPLDEKETARQFKLAQQEIALSY